MSENRSHVVGRIAGMILLVWAPTLWAAPRTPGDSAQPHIAYLFPAGGQRGATVRVTAGGVHLQNAAEVRVSGTGVTAKVVADPAAPGAATRTSGAGAAKRPKAGAADTPATTLTLTVTISPEAELGDREVRVLTPDGVSNGFRFVVGQIKEVSEQEPNNERDAAHRLEGLPVVVNGQITESDRDYFRFTATAGQTIVCAVQARELLPYIADAVPGWNDVVLTLFDAAGRKLQCVDDTLLRPDPVLIFVPPADGEYVLEVRDVLYRGRADFVYRLSVGATPYVTHLFPLGARRGSTATVTAYGVNLPGSSRELTIPASTGETEATRRMFVEGAGGVRSNALPLAIGRQPEIREREPNDAPAAASLIEWPCTVNGRIDRPGDADYFAIAGKSGQKVAIEVTARRLGSPVDAIVTLYGPGGAKAAESDDVVDPTDGLLTHHADARVLFTFPSTGNYLVRVRDVQGKGGPEYGYRLTVAPPRPGFALRVSPDNPRVARGDSAAITVTAVRLDGYAGPIDLSVTDLPVGFTATAAAIPAGQAAATLTVTAPADATTGICSPTILGSATIGGQQVVHQAAGAEALLQAFTLTQLVPSREFVLAVVDAPASFALTLASPANGIVEVRRGGTAEIRVGVARRDGMKAAVGLRALNVPPGITVRPAQVPPDQMAAVLVVAATQRAPLDVPLNLVLTGTHRAGKETTSRTLPAITVRVVPAP